jgi:hypothetical protein
MIPYDDLVAALSAWRARQGLPVSTMGGAPASGPHAAPIAAAPAPTSGPRTAPPGRSAPPAAPPRGKPVSVPPPLAHPDVEEEVDAAMLDEAAYDNEGGDFAMAFGNDGDSATAIGGPPQRDTQPATPRGRGGKNGW